MGLHINKYRYSYRILQKLREYALKSEHNKSCIFCEDLERAYSELDKIDFTKKDWDKKEKELTSYPNFINHTDCNGGYISCKNIGVSLIPSADRIFWRDLDELKKEVEELSNNDIFLELCREGSISTIKCAWDDFYADVTECDDILRFR
ncbi:hypothetical protein KY314_02910 [Candidatus Woesearchaeota archaeon]|nr:hypothetical protein [Candidatus Woesearchaeota archaeon]